MRHPFTSSLRFRLVLLVLLGGIPSFVLFMVTAEHQRQIAAEEVKDNALRIARVASSGQERIVEGARQILLLLSRLPEVRGGDSERCSALLADLMSHYPYYANIGVIEMDGSVFASGVHMPNMEQVNLSDRAYFRGAVESGELAMGEYQIGRITGKATVNFGYPVRNDEGRIVRVVYTALDLDWLESLAREIELPEGSTLLVADQRGQILMHYPNSARWRGRSLLDTPSLAPMASRGEGTLRARGLDGHARLYAFTPLRAPQGSGVVSVGVGIPDSLAYAEASRMLKRNITILVLLALAVLAAAWAGSEAFVLRQVRSLLGVIGRMQAGDLSARTGVRQVSGELDRLSHAFDAMASSLEERVRERERAERAVRKLNLELEQRVAARTRELREKNEQMSDDLNLAHDFQTSLLPPPHVQVPSQAQPGDPVLCFHHRYQPSSGVGGDFFEVLGLANGSVGLFVCDVMGHGIRAALVTAIIRGLAQELRPIAGNPGRFASELHRALFDIFNRTNTGMFSAGLYMVVDTATGLVQCTNAGIPRPLLLRRARGAVEWMPLARESSGPALGLIEESTYGATEIALEPGDVVLVFSDGLFEVSDARNQEFGEDRLKEAVRRRIQRPTEFLVQELVEEVRAFASDAKFLDDVCVVGMEWTTAADRSA